MIDIYPSYESIPQSVKDRVNQLPAQDKYHRLMTDWFFEGLSMLELRTKDNVDPFVIKRRLMLLLNDRSISHEHKKAAFVWICEQTLDDAKWKKAS